MPKKKRRSSFPKTSQTYVSKYVSKKEKMDVSKKGRKPVIKKYMLMSVSADRAIRRVGTFPKGVWKEVPFEMWRQFKDADGWKGKTISEEF